MLSLTRRRSTWQVLSLMRRHHLAARGRKRSYHEVSFLQRGDPLEVLEYYQSQYEPKDPPSEERSNYVKVKMLAAPWNPADKNTVQGKYPSPLKHPHPQSPSIRGEAWKVAGSEGWGQIEISSSDSPLLAPQTFVTLGASGTGTFRSSVWLPKRDVIPIERAIDLKEKLGTAAAVSALFQLGGTAWRMLHDFESLSEGSIVLHNAGNSGVGWMVSQLAAERGIHVISLVRRGSRSEEDFKGLVEALTTQQSTNTTQVIAEEDLLENKDALKELQARMGKHPRLAFNAVGGSSAGLLLKMLAPGGTIVTYGGLSMQPVTVATPQLIFKDIKVRGYWHSRWMARALPKERKRMVDDLVSSVLDGNTSCPPIQVFALSQVQEALKFEADQSLQAVRRKVVFNCHEEGR